MMNMANLATLACMLFYLIAVIQLLANLSQTSKTVTDSSSPVPLLGLIGAVMHFIVILIDAQQNQGLSSSFFDALSITAFIVVSMCLIAQTRYPLRVLFIPIFLISIVCVAMANRVSLHIPIVASSPAMLTHILSSIIAYSLLCIAALQAVALQMIDYSLRERSDSIWLRQLPPLQTIETLLFQFITIGWLILTIALVSGGIYIEDFFSQHLAHKTILSLLSWLLFGLLLLGRHRYGWRGSLAVKWTLTAFITLVLAYFGTHFVLEIILKKTA